MAERQSGGSGNLVVAIIIAIIVGTVVYFLIDSRPAGEVQTSVTTGDVIIQTGTDISSELTGS